MIAKLELVRSWLTRAQHDLASARKLSSGSDPYLDVAVYHCQQAAEKAVKGFLIYHDQAFPKTHDIGVLVELAVQYSAALSSWRSAAALLTPYATEFRYPTTTPEPSPAEFDEAIERAEGLYLLVLGLLPSDVHPPA